MRGEASIATKVATSSGEVKRLVAMLAIADSRTAPGSTPVAAPTVRGHATLAKPEVRGDRSGRTLSDPDAPGAEFL